MPLTLNTLLNKLDTFIQKIPLDDLQDLLKDLEVDPQTLAPYTQFQMETYKRNLIRAGENYHALLLCWKNGHRSPIHDHRDSRCAFRVMQGTATETVFLKSPNGHVYPTGSRELSEGTTGLSENSDMHQISNLQGEGDLITLHVYSPPLLVMGQYSLTTGAVSDFIDPVFEFSEGTGI